MEIVKKGEIKGMKKRIKMMYFQDRMVIFSFMISFWAILSYVMVNISYLDIDYTIKLIILLAGILAGIFGTTALIAVLIHLKKNCDELYMQDVMASMENNKH